MPTDTYSVLSCIATIATHFAFDGTFLQAGPCGNGHIHDSYAAWFRRADGSEHRYLIQRINQYVFHKPAQVMENILAITQHLSSKIAAQGGDAERGTLHVVPTVEGQPLYVTEDGAYWRAYRFIEGVRSYEVVENQAHVYNAARAFGVFQRQLGDFPVERLHDTIPDFHNTPKRFAAFLTALGHDSQGRAQSARAEIHAILRRAPITSILVNLAAAGRLPLRVTHNDTKFNNVLIDDQSGEGICVIDLDTVMPGLSAYDFGDAVRSGANTGAEDEPDLSRVEFSLEVFQHYAHGYLDAARDFLTPLEIDYLPLSAIVITLEQAIRFLTDHLNGDVYYKIHRPGHNLDRTRTQLKLVQEMEARFEEMVAAVDRYRSVT